MPCHLFRRVLASCVVSVALPASSEAGQAQPATEPAPLCRAAADPTYAFTAERPVQVGGGGTVYGGARQRHYLDSLRGPRGETLTHSRRGSTLGPDGDTMLDMYTVTYDGLAAEVTMYLDLYHYVEPLAPQGFVCGRAPDLGTPPPNKFVGDEQLAALAADIAAAAGFRAGPVPLGGDPEAGVVVDRFRAASRRLRTGVTLPPPTASRPALPGTIVIAYPQTCGDRRVSPSRLALAAGPDNALGPTATITDKRGIADLVPGQQIPDGSMAATFEADALLQGLRVRVSFADAACTGELAERLIPIAYSAARLLESPMPARPADDTTGVPWVAVQALIDHQGVFQQLRPLGGPPALVRAAVEAIATWKAQPIRANGAPVASPVVLMVTFRAP